MAEELGLNAVISDTVTGMTTLVLKDVPADQVIDIIFQQKGLDMRKKGNIIMIAPRDEIATREKLEFESKQQNSDLEPLKLEQFVMNYQKAADVARLLAGLPLAGAAAAPAAPGANIAAQRLLSKRGSAIADPQSNILFVNDIPSKLEEIRSFIKAIDVGARQVLIEARVVEANDTFNRELGVKMNFLTRKAEQIGNSGLYVGGGAYAPPTSTSSATTTGGVTTVNSTYTPGVQTTANALGVNLPSFSSTGGTLALSLFNASLTRILNLELAALESDGIGKIISSPRVITANNVKAKIEDGTEIPYVTTQTTGGAITQTVAFKSAKLSLEATPQITPEGTVRMLLVVKKEEPDYTRAILGNPPIKSSIVETNVVVENGGTVVIGGVFVTDSQNAVEKVPVLGDIPYLGWLFKYKNETGKRRELLVFITPRIVSDKLRFD
jgi:type IV pilus assembly protein PilQ